MRQYIAKQLSNPTGVIGKYLLGHLWNRRNKVLNDVTIEKLRVQEDDRILDIGFGGGYLITQLLPLISKGVVAGIDISSVLVERCQGRYRKEIFAERIDIRAGQAEDLPFPDNTFTKVCSVNSIFFWNDLQQGINEIFRTLQNNGCIVLTFTKKQDLEKRGFNQKIVTPYHEEDILEKMTNVGFRKNVIEHYKDRHRELLCMIGEKNVD